MKRQQLSLFPDIVPNCEIVHFGRKYSGNDEQHFLSKFEAKHTTDECYTPVEVYDAVLNFCRERYPQIFAENPNILRPFKPGGDYQSEDYTGAVVVDNPPFSLAAKIYDFYLKNNVPFFLFANHLTCLRNDQRLSFVLANSQIKYANGAIVSTSFATNFQSGIIENCKALTDAIKAVQDNKKVKRIAHHKNVVQAATLARYGDLRLTYGKDFLFCKKPYLSYRPFAESIIISDSVAAMLGREEDSNLQLSPEAVMILEKLNKNER